MDWFCVLERLCKTSRIFSTVYGSGVLFEPPKKILCAWTRCDSKFCLEGIVEMLKDEKSYGIVLISGKETKCYKVIISGKHIEHKLIGKKTVQLQKHQKKGGQSADRIERIRQGKYLNYQKESEDFIVKSFQSRDIDDTSMEIHGIIVGGPGELKKTITKRDKFRLNFNSSCPLLKIVDTAEIREETIRDVISLCDSIMLPESCIKEKKIFEEIENLVTMNPDILAFGRDEVLNLLESQLLKSIYIEKEIYDIIKDDIERLNTYECDITIGYIKRIYPVVGIKWY
jgi:peptide chain release factor subunit 1